MDNVPSRITPRAITLTDNGKQGRSHLFSRRRPRLETLNEGKRERRIEIFATRLRQRSRYPETGDFAASSGLEPITPGTRAVYREKGRVIAAIRSVHRTPEPCRVCGSSQKNVMQRLFVYAATRQPRGDHSCEIIPRRDCYASICVYPTDALPAVPFSMTRIRLNL